MLLIKTEHTEPWNIPNVTVNFYLMHTIIYMDIKAFQTALGTEVVRLEHLVEGSEISA